MPLFAPQIWPNFFRAQISPSGNEFGGRPFFSQEERLRRHRAVQKKLREQDCDLLIVQGYFPPSTMGVNTSLYWLGADNYYKNTFTLILPAKGELITVHGTKTSEADWRVGPYTSNEDMSPYLRGARRIAYDGLGLITKSFYDYLQQVCPGVELVDFCQDLAELRACKSEEELDAIRHTCAIQDAMFRAAPLFIQPGRTCTEVYADITRYLMLLGGDPTQMFKLVMYLGDATAHEGQAGSPQFWIDPDYRMKQTDYIQLTLETPGCGGYYAERSRYFFFQPPTSEFSAVFQQALKLQEFQLNCYKLGMSMGELRDTINRYKLSLGAEPSFGKDWISGEVRGIGNTTVCRPLIQYEWEPLRLMKNMVLVSTHRIVKDGWNLPLHETVWIDEKGSHILGDYPQQITVL